jgi:phage shock protein PspC (stress-responsive transcriptional regulator)
MNQKVIGGVVGGLAGGVVFGMMMAMIGMLPMIAGMVGSASAVVGFLVHMVISSMSRGCAP